MEERSKDELFEIAMKLDLPDLLAFCSTFKKISELCQGDRIWRFKLENEFSEYLDFEVDKSLKERYKLLYSLRDVKEKLNLEGSLVDIYNLTELGLTDKQLTSLPESIGNLSNLQSFYCYPNKS